MADHDVVNVRYLVNDVNTSVDGERPTPGGWNRIHRIVDNIDTEVAQLSTQGVTFRSEIVSGPGGQQVLAIDPSGNFIELFQPAAGR